MDGWIGVTDNEWFDFLSRQSGIDEVNFWQAGGRTLSRALDSGGLFPFRFHENHQVIGGGFLSHGNSFRHPVDSGGSSS